MVLALAEQDSGKSLKAKVSEDELKLCRKIAHQLFTHGVIPAPNVHLLAKFALTKFVTEYMGMQKKAVESLDREGR